MDQNEKDLLQAIAQIDDWKGKAIHYEAVTGGITNPNWKVIVDGKPYFVKVPGRGTEAFIDRKNAHLANQIAAKEAIGPKIYYFLENSGVEVFEFLEGYRTLNYGDVFNRDIFYKIVATIRRFHQHHETRLPLTQTPFEQTRTFMQLAKQSNCYLPPDMERMEWLAVRCHERCLLGLCRHLHCQLFHRSHGRGMDSRLLRHL